METWEQKHRQKKKNLTHKKFACICQAPQRSAEQIRVLAIRS